jgi:hypothetical protein
MHSLVVSPDHPEFFLMPNDDDDVDLSISNWVLRLKMMSVVLFHPGMMIKVMMDHLSRNWNWVHSSHLNIVPVELVNDVASLNAHVNDVDSSSN